MLSTQALYAGRIDSQTGRAQQDVGEQSSAHADLAVYAPHRKLDALAVERLTPRQHVLIHAIHECTVEIEEESGLYTRHVSFSDGRVETARYATRPDASQPSMSEWVDSEPPSAHPCSVVNALPRYPTITVDIQPDRSGCGSHSS